MKECIAQQVTPGYHLVELELTLQSGRTQTNTITQVILAVMVHGHGRLRRRRDRRGGHPRQSWLHIGCRQPQGRLMTVPDKPLIITAPYTKTAGTLITVHIIRSGSRAAGISDNLPITDSTTATTDSGREIQTLIEIRKILAVSTLV